MTQEPHYSPGVQRYIDKAAKVLAEEAKYREKMKKCHFDTIAVHGMYSVQESLENNQGSIVEPIYMATSQAYRDSDEMEAALAYLIPTWCYSRIANPSVYYLERLYALLEGYGTPYETFCCATSASQASWTRQRSRSL